MDQTAIQRSAISNKALGVLAACTTPQGLLASPTQHDNYQRVWARDSMVAGLAALVANHEPTILAMEQSVHTLGQYQAANGQIPSNVNILTQHVSFGTLVGRVDATTWWLVGAGLLLKHFSTADKLKHRAIKRQWKPLMRKALALLHHWEYNQRGLLYTPLGGNWADEYICQGYTLYDNVLRLWALELAAEQLNDDACHQMAKKLRSLLLTNFFTGADEAATYHPTAYAKAEAKPYFWFQFGPAGYDCRFDMAGNALALLLNLHPAPAALEQWCLDLASQQGHGLLPVFHPIIQPGEPDWRQLELNYLNSFKNRPHHFHNGGCWPVFLGMLALGLAKHGLHTASSIMCHDLSAALQADNFRFHEYWATDNKQPGGVQPLAYTASGWLLMDAAMAAQQSTLTLPF